MSSFPYLCNMKRLILKLAAIGLVIIFLGHVTGIEVSEHTCFECGTIQVESCDIFHEQHQDHSNSCSFSFHNYTIPFKVIEKSDQNLRNPLTFLIREMNLFQVSSEKPGFLNTSITQNPVSGNILLKTCQSLT